MYEIQDLLFALPVVLLVVYWWINSDQKKVAIAAARSYCRERGLQLLDGTLVSGRFRVERDGRNRRRLCRSYRFDYCLTGTDRHSGEIVLSGYSVLRVILDSGALEITQFRE